jgi:molybdate/tungstate transport system substrate-binding protein
LPEKREITAFLIAGAVIASLIAGPTLSGCAGKGKTQLKVFHADSLTIPFQEIEKQFELKYPDVDVMLDGHGSIQVIRAVTELHQDVDLAAVADSQLISLLMYNTQMPDKKGPYADWLINFATNALGIAYTDKSPYATEISGDNWYEIMSRPDVKIGLADARIDALGYRVLMAVQLAESYYRDDSIFEQLFDGAFTIRLGSSFANGVTTITVPQLYKSAQERMVLRSYSLQLLALLESGDIDYSFEYESVAKQHGLKFLSLPPAFDLSSEDYADTYGKVSVVMDFQRFMSVNPEFRGAPIVYGITIPKNAPHPKEAAEFMQFLFGPEGQQVLTENFQPPLLPPEADDKAKIPDDIRSLVK